MNKECKSTVKNNEIILFHVCVSWTPKDTKTWQKWKWKVKIKQIIKSERERERDRERGERERDRERNYVFHN